MPDYTPLRDVLDRAFSQSAEGKGRERHARGVDFDRQPIMEIGRMVGPGFATGQAMKKVQESIGMVARADLDAAITELLGAIVYCAAAVALMEEMKGTTRPADVSEPIQPPVQYHTPRSRTPLSDAMKAVEAELGR